MLAKNFQHEVKQVGLPSLPPLKGDRMLNAKRLQQENRKPTSGWCWYLPGYLIALRSKYQLPDIFWEKMLPLFGSWIFSYTDNLTYIPSPQNKTNIKMLPYSGTCTFFKNLSAFLAFSLTWAPHKHLCLCFSSLKLLWALFHCQVWGKRSLPLLFSLHIPLLTPPGTDLSPCHLTFLSQVLSAFLVSGTYESFFFSSSASLQHLILSSPPGCSAFVSPLILQSYSAFPSFSSKI